MARNHMLVPITSINTKIQIRPINPNDGSQPMVAMFTRLHLMEREENAWILGRQCR
jgi:hypothetical protein